ncbi:RNA polymerase sigma factor [Roseococcus sp. SDR]|uniref:RNA polymerase sigma factor n=1 Tax=Roseococcus sp. SDR TaxID=2835532 RepID=UPI001BCC71D9|nr:RNA polymerase sigma factor [Roseococcus sp. SDR]MBS7792334.1 RNA polymerase sigma factor [Roseococcus sp. SDR]MBV1847648.1 RNA polymerase sigma factor [Roseococcus sp. SDR]
MTHDEPLLRAFLLQRGVMERRIARRVGCRAAAADLVQDLFLRLWQRPPVDAHAAARYLTVSARNIATDHLRAVSHRAPRAAISPDLPDRSPAPDAVLAGRQELEAVEAALAALPERTRQAFLLNRVHERTCPEIAQLLGVSLATVERDIARALLACRAILDRG